MQLIHIERHPTGDEAPIGWEGLYLVDLPDSEFERFTAEIEDSISSYLEHVDEADEQSAQQIADTVMQNCGRPYTEISRIARLEI